LSACKSIKRTAKQADKLNIFTLANNKKGLSKKALFRIYKLPPPTPPYTGGELITKRFLPLCKGELVGVGI